MQLEQGDDRATELDLLPVGVLRIDAGGTILGANRTAQLMVGVDLDDVLGRSILEFSAEPIERGMSLLDFGSQTVGVPMGPVPVRYRHAGGAVRTGDVWAENHLADPDVGAIVMVLVPEASAPSIAAALSSVAEGASVDATLELLAHSLRAHPFDASGCWLVHDDRGRRLVGGDSLPEAVRVALATPGMWWSGLHQQDLVDISDVAIETDEHHLLLRAAGVAAWWLQPIPKGITGTGDAAIIVIRDAPGGISPNQAEHLGRIVTTAGLAVERAAMQARLSYAAYHDSLTGVGNRERFFEGGGPPLHAGSALLYLDLDHFKEINDVHGHTAGDLVLVTVADRLRKAVRPGDRITRMGGDEFVIECEGLVDDRETIHVAERIIEAVQRPIELGGAVVEVGASLGIAHCDTEDSLDALLERSDQALYAAKAAGRGRWHMAG